MHYDFLKVPAPSPWGLKNGLFYRGNDYDYIWKKDESSTFSGMTKLFNSNGKVVFILDFYCYIQNISGPVHLIWHEKKSKGIIRGDGITIVMVDFEKLSEIADYDNFANQMRKQNMSIGFQGKNGIICEYDLPSLPEGINSFKFPDSLKQLDEILVLADYNKTNMIDKIKILRAIYVFNFKMGQVEVFPQDWFNNGDFDFEYQWITQVVRRSDGKICGIGSRISSFLLDASNRNRT